MRPSKKNRVRYVPLTKREKDMFDRKVLDMQFCHLCAATGRDVDCKACDRSTEGAHEQAHKLQNL